MRKEDFIPMNFTVHVFIEEREGACVATCLEMGLVATADNAEELPRIMEKLITRQFTFGLENNNPSDIFRPAEPDVWERFRHAMRKEKGREIRKIERPMHVKDWSDLELSQISYAAAAC